MLRSWRSQIAHINFTLQVPFSEAWWHVIVVRRAFTIRTIASSSWKINVWEEKISLFIHRPFASRSFRNSTLGFILQLSEGERCTKNKNLDWFEMSFKRYWKTEKVKSFKESSLSNEPNSHFCDSFEINIQVQPEELTQDWLRLINGCVMSAGCQ